MQATDLNVCLLPLEITWEDKEANLNNLQKHLELVHPETDLVIIPETFSTGFPSGEEKDYVRNFAERNTGDTIDFIKRLAKKYNFAIAGSFIADSGGSLFNRGFFIEPSGEEVFADKRHLFSPGGEHKVFSQGAGRMSVRYRGWNISMAVCYDLRFPVWCRNRNNEYDLLIVVANWPVPRVKVWESLLIARALENLSYVCGVNCKGIDRHGHEYNGLSMAVGPTGENLAVSLKEDGILYAALSKKKLEEFRNKFPAWQDADDFSISL